MKRLFPHEVHGTKLEVSNPIPMQNVALYMNVEYPGTQ